MKNRLYIFTIVLLGIINKTMAYQPEVPALGLPGDSKTPDDVVGDIGGKLISTFIEYVAIIAVISLMISGIMYLIANGEEEKTKKAKNWIIWSLAGVLLSISAWGIINIINNLSINN